MDLSFNSGLLHLSPRRCPQTSISVTSDLSTRSSASLNEEQFEDYGEGEEPDYLPSSPSPDDETRTHGYSDLGSSVPSRCVSGEPTGRQGWMLRVGVNFILRCGRMSFFLEAGMKLLLCFFSKLCFLDWISTRNLQLILFLSFNDYFHILDVSVFS